jgi:hypothetical protein
MLYRLTDSRLVDTRSPGLPLIELHLDLSDDEAEDPDDPQVTKEHAQELIDWWMDYPGRNAEILEDGGIITLVETSDDHDRTPMIGTWYQVDHDWLWPLDGFPFTSLSYQRVPDDELDTTSSGSRQHYIETGRYLTRAEVAEHEELQITSVGILSGGVYTELPYEPEEDEQ